MGALLEIGASDWTTRSTSAGLKSTIGAMIRIASRHFRWRA
ncbi:MAG: hypothetical protein U0992_07400 [Planctomycetaceae bacterium]